MLRFRCSPSTPFIPPTRPPVRKTGTFSIQLGHVCCELDDDIPVTRTATTGLSYNLTSRLITQITLYTRSYLFWTKIWVVLSNFARPALDDCIAEHCDDHHKQEVAGVHEVQVNERAIVLSGKRTQFASVNTYFNRLLYKL